MGKLIIEAVRRKEDDMVHIKILPTQMALGKEVSKMISRKPKSSSMAIQHNAYAITLEGKPLFELFIQLSI